MNSGAPRSEKVLPQADENRSRASTNSYYQLLLQKCRSRRATREWSKDPLDHGVGMRGRRRWKLADPIT
jgi:hypothetical protein